MREGGHHCLVGDYYRGEKCGVTLHSHLILATPMHAIHLGTKQQAHTEYRFAQWDSMSLP